MKKIEELAKTLLEKLDVAAEIKVSSDEEGAILVDFEGEDLGILIGYHGEQLLAIQLFLELALYKELGEWTRVSVDVGGYREEKVVRLEEMAMRAVEKARFLQKPVPLSPMSSYERRIVHTKVSQIEGVLSESEGEGWERHVVVKPK